MLARGHLWVRRTSHKCRVLKRAAWVLAYRAVGASGVACANRYGDMQLICEAYHLLKSVAGLSNIEMHEVYCSALC